MKLKGPQGLLGIREISVRILRRLATLSLEEKLHSRQK